MSRKRLSLLSQAGLEVVIPTTPEPPPKVFFPGPAVPEKDDRGPSSSPLLAARGRNRSNLQQPLISAWSNSPTSEYGSLFPRSAYYRQSPWSAATAAQQQQQQLDGSSRWPSSNGQYIRPERRTFAFLGRTKFWLILGPIFMLLAISLAVGLGVGLGRFRNTGGGGETNTTTAGDTSDGGGSSGDVTVETVNPTKTTPTTTKTAASPTVSVLILAPTPIKCPDANGTVYQAFPGKDPFLVLCDVTYNNNNDNNGIGVSSVANNSSSSSKDTESVEECIEACGDDSSCAGASWGKSQGKFTCWMKESLGEGSEEPNWFSVIKQEPD